MNTYYNLISDPSNKIKFLLFARELGLDDESAKKAYNHFALPDRNKVNGHLASKNHFPNISEAVNFLYDSLKAGGYKMPDYLWPSLETEQNVRVKIELDNKHNLVVCFYKFKSGTVECIAYIS